MIGSIGCREDQGWRNTRRLRSRWLCWLFGVPDWQDTRSKGRWNCRVGRKVQMAQGGHQDRRCAEL